jgi:hypothetical protein
MGASSNFDYARSTDTTRNFSPIIWNQVDVQALKNGIDGYLFEDDFFDLPTGKWTATQATAGTFALDDQEGGVALADCNSTTDNQGINVQLGGTAGEFISAPESGLLIYEARIKLADIATGPQFFAGLAETDTTLIASGAMDGTSKFIGFKSVTDDGVILGCSQSTAESTASSIHTAVDDAYVKLGFIVKNRTTISFYVNGALKANTITTTANIPSALLRPSFVCQSAGTTDPILHIDRVRVAVWNGAL